VESSSPELLRVKVLDGVVRYRELNSSVLSCA